MLEAAGTVLEPLSFERGNRHRLIVAVCLRALNRERSGDCLRSPPHSGFHGRLRRGSSGCRRSHAVVR